MFFWKKEEHHHEEEQHEEEKLNDLSNPEEKSDADISGIFLLTKIQTLKKLLDKNTRDLKVWLKKYINYSLEKKIKILKLKNPINDIKKVKNIKLINLNKNIPEIDKDTINAMDLGELNRQSWPHFDLFIPDYPIHIKSNLYLKKLFRNIRLYKFKTFSILFSIFFVLIFFYSYFSFVKYKVNDIILQAKSINFKDDISVNQWKVENIKFDIIFLKFITKPVFVLNYVLNNQNIDNFSYILSWASSLSDSILDLIFVYNSFDINIKNKSFENFYIWEFFKNSYPYLTKSFFNLNDWLFYLEKVKIPAWSDLSKPYYENLEKLKKFRDFYSLFLENSTTIEKILWDEKKRTYMLVFQNNDEIRPTWGFMWSVVFFDIFKWKLQSYEKKDIYAIEWNIKPFSETAPEWIDKISDTFWLRDANYFPNIEESSLKIKSFLDKTWKEIDGIVYINQNIVLEFLDYFGWVYFPELKTKLDSSNFSMMTSTLVESKLYKEWTLWTPKQILFDFILVFFKELREKADYNAYLNLALNSVKENDVLVYSFHKEENEFFKKLWFKTDLVDTSKLDFNYPVFTSISWNKSDRYIKRSFEKTTNIDKSCLVNTNLKITSTHNFWINDELWIKGFLYNMWVLWDVDLNTTLAIQWKGTNRQFVRVYIPKDAIINNSPNYNINVLNDRKEISFYLETPVSSKKSFNFNYSLPNTECKKYEYEFIKQPWLKWYDLKITQNWNLIVDWYNSSNYNLK